MKRIAIIGAGIGGLTATLAFKRKGLNVIVYESAAEIKPVGAGIGIDVRSTSTEDSQTIK